MNTVIASAAKQSISRQREYGLLRRYAPRNDAVGRSSIRGKTIQQAVAAGALEVGLRTAAVRPARGVRRVPGFRGVVVAQPDAVGVPEHGGTLRRTRPVLAGAVVAGHE